MSKMSSPAKTPNSTRPRGRLLVRQKATLVGLGAITLLLLFSVTKMALAYRRVRNDRLIAQEELQKTQEQYESLSSSVSRLSTPRGKEEELRTRYRAIMPGENLVVVLPDENPESLEKPTFGARLGIVIGRGWQTISYTFMRLFTVPDSDTLIP